MGMMLIRKRRKDSRQMRFEEIWDGCLNVI